MRPTLAAQQLRDTTVEYLTTTFALAEPETQDALTAFLTDPADGIFRGPYLRIRRPFRPATDGWEQYLDWCRTGFEPFAHQAEAFARLSSKDGRTPRPTLITTGTGSGKTESFLYPVVDHCRREKAAGKHGVKAVLLYPMNALAGDQASRLGDLLDDQRLLDAGVTAGLYIGEASASGGESPYKRVMVDRAEIRRNPPDILITNYKMLDLLIQRQQDASLWRDADLAYIVIDEFHTYDGAQGTDVAMLLRRLAVAAGADEPGRPLGRICPVATSATLGTAGGGEAAGPGAEAGPRPMLDFASQVFGTKFPNDAVVGEDRLPIESFLTDVDPTLPVPTPAELAALPDPAREQDALADVARAVLGSADCEPRELGRRLLAHPLTHALLRADVHSPVSALEALSAFDEPSWRLAATADPSSAERALARFVALLSAARKPDAPRDKERPLVLIETHLWVRSLSRVLRFTAPEPVFSWTDDDQAALTGTTAIGGQRPAGGAVTARADLAGVTGAAQADRRRRAQRTGRLPAAYCRHCGRSGWAAVCPERNPLQLEHAPDEIYRRSASGGAAKGRVRALIEATPAEAAEQARLLRDQRTRRGRRGTSGQATVMVLEDNGQELRAIDPDEVLLDGGKIADSPENGVFVTAWMHNRDQDEFARQDRCPACGQSQGIRFLGAGVAPLTSVVVTQLFTGGELPARDEQGRDRRRTLIFNDSVQDAAHRAGFVASRAWKFSLRSLLYEQLRDRSAANTGEEADGVPLNEVIADLVIRAADDEEKLLSSVVPPDMRDIDRVKKLLAGSQRAGEPSWSLVGERLAFNTLLEFGLSSRWGRTLELTRTVAAEVHLPDPELAAQTAQALYEKQLNSMLPTMDDEPAGEGEDGRAPAPAAEGELPASGPERLRRFEGYVRMLLEHIRAGGGIFHRWLDAFVDDEGRNRYLLTRLRAEGMPAFPRGTQAPAFVLLGARAGRTNFERADSAESWFTDYTVRCLGGLDRTGAAAFVAALLPRLAEPDIGALALRATGDAKKSRQRGPGVYGLTAGHVRVRPLADTETHHAAVTCPDCGWTQTVAPERRAVWKGMRCPLKQCDGLLTVPSRTAAGRAGRDHRYDYYRRLYRESGPYNVVAAEHTGVLKRKEREAVEKGFRRGTLHTDPNVISCTPTLELGIDIGQLEAVILASLPATTASYVQRVGRAGRATGNAFMVSLADNSPRALYHLSEPRHLIDGPITPPGCFLSAGELLCRQYTAYLLDLAARGRLRDVPPLVDRASHLFGQGSWTKALSRAACGRTDYAHQFLALFPKIDSVRDSGVSDEARETLLEYAQTGLAEALRDAEAAWNTELASLQARRKQINEAAEALHENIEDEARDKKALGREAAALGDRLQEISHVGAQGFLVEQGLLPNYSLVEEGVRLEATLNHKRPPSRGRAKGADPAAERTRWRPEVRTYDRPATAALSELAPGNAYYARGYRHEINGFDLGPQHTAAEGTQADAAPPVLRTWRVCGECGHVRTGDDAAHDTGPCPRCASTSIGGRNALHTVVVPRKVLSRDKREDARIIDDRDDRKRITYTTVTAVDIAPNQVKESWRHTRATFGVDHVREAVIRRFNLGRARPGRRADTFFAGTETNLTGFVLCPLCGGATDREPGQEPAQEELSESALNSPEHAHHFPWCAVRRRDRRTAPRDLTGVLTAAEHRTEALRILLPAATLNVPVRLASFSAALHLGLARHYGGDPAHIRSTPATEPDRESELTRHYLVLYDALPGGTGYLQRLVDNNGEDFRAVLAAAQRVLLSCPCQKIPGRRACHRCLLPYAQTQREYKDLDRQEALWMLEGLLGPDGHSGWQTNRRPAHDADRSAEDRIRFVKQAESDLERRFITCLDTWLTLPGNGGADHATTPTGRQGKQFALSTPDGRSVSWEVVAQKSLTGYRTRPDLLFRPVAGAVPTAGPTPPSVAVYLDGYRWHASARTNRIASDAAKRARLRADGTLVWQITWDDVMAWEKNLGKQTEGQAARRGTPEAATPDALARVIAGPAAEAAWPPYPVEGENSPGGKVRAKWAAAKQNPAVLDSYVYSGAIPSFLGFLRHPTPALWQQLAVRALTGLLAAEPKPVPVAADPVSAVPWIESVLRGQTPERPGGQGLTLLQAHDGSSLPLLLVVDRRQDKKQVWSALVVLDDREDAVRGDRPDHRRRWKAWLNWGNLVQFLDPTGAGRADGIALARTAVDDFDASLLAVTAGPATGLLTALRGEKTGHGLSVEEPLEEALPETAGSPSPVVTVEPISEPRVPQGQPELPTSAELALWRVVQDELSDGNPDVRQFAGRFIAEYAGKHPNLPVAEVLWDVNGVTMAVELAWPQHKVGVVPPEVAQNEDDMAQFARQGWDVRPVDRWSVDELAARLLGSSANRQEGDA